MFHLKAIKEVEEVEVVAVADPNRSRMEGVRRKSGAKRGYLDFKELLHDSNVDAVAVNTPPRFHEEMVLESLAAGKHVLCEKPLARSVRGCQNIKTAQEVTGLVVLPVHNYAFTPCLGTAMDEIGKEQIGKVEKVELRFDNNLGSYRSRTDFRLREEYSIVEDLLPHVLSVIHVLVAPVTELGDAKGWRKSHEVVDNLSLSLRAKDGVELECAMNWTSLIPGFKVEVLGTEGKLDMDLMKFPYRVNADSKTGKKTYDKSGLGKYLDLIQLKHPAFRIQYRHFVDVVDGAEAPRFTIEDEVTMLRLMNEVVNQLSETSIS